MNIIIHRLKVNANSFLFSGLLLGLFILGCASPVVTDIEIPSETITYALTFDANGGTGDMTAMAIAPGSSQNLEPNLFSNSVHNFVQWTTEADGTGTVYADLDSYTMGTEDATLYAQWTKTLTLDVNGGTGENTYFELATGESMSLPIITSTRTGYDYIGQAAWFDDIGMRTYANGDTFTMETTDVLLMINWRSARR